MRARTAMARSVPQTMDETTERLALFETAQAAIGGVIASLAAQAYAEETSGTGDRDKAHTMRLRMSQLRNEGFQLDYNDPESLKATIAKYATPPRHA